MFKEKSAKKGSLSKKADNKRKEIEDTMEKTEFKTYIQNLQQFASANFVIIVLDARNPCACRYQPYEELLGEKMLLVLNKIDLIPREAVIAWHNSFSTLSRTFSVSAIHGIDPLLAFFKTNTSLEDPTKVVITGVCKSGKKTITAQLKHLPGLTIESTKPWIWLKPTPDLVALGSLEKSKITNSLIASSRDFLSRCSIHSLMEAFGMTFFNDSDAVFNSPLLKEEKTKRTAALKLFDMLATNQLPYYTTPPTQMPCTELSSEQKAAFRLSKTCDMFETPIIALGSFTFTTVMEWMLPALHDLAAKNKERERKKHENA